MRCPDCNLGTLDCGECEICGLTTEDVEDAANYFDGLMDDDYYEDDMTDVEDEDYGFWEYGWEG